MTGSEGGKTGWAPSPRTPAIRRHSAARPTERPQVRVPSPPVSRLATRAKPRHLHGLSELDRRPTPETPGATSLRAGRPAASLLLVRGLGTSVARMCPPSRALRGPSMANAAARRGPLMTEVRDALGGDRFQEVFAREPASTSARRSQPPPDPPSAWRACPRRRRPQFFTREPPSPRVVDALAYRHRRTGAVMRADVTAPTGVGDGERVQLQVTTICSR